jgi:hypothetical protein
MDHLEALAKTKRELVAQREAFLERAATLERIRTSLATPNERIEHEQQALEHMTYQERRDVLQALGVSVNVWTKGHGQRYEVTMAYDISAWLDPAFLVDQPEIEDEIDELTWAGLVPKTVYRSAPTVHVGRGTQGSPCPARHPLRHRRQLGDTDRESDAATGCREAQCRPPRMA